MNIFILVLDSEIMIHTKFTGLRGGLIKYEELLIVIIIIIIIII